MRRVAPASPLTEILEGDWDRQLFRGPHALATRLGWSTYHTLRSQGSKSGYPDRTCVRDRIIFAELKREKTHPTDAQRVWLDKLAAAGGEVYLWRPSDLDEIALILASRATHIYQGGETNPIGITRTTGDWWTPRSLWIPGIGRADSTHNEQQTLLTTKGAAA